MNSLTISSKKLADVLIALEKEKHSDTALVLAYMMEHQNDKFFSCRKGSRKLAISRMKITNKRWEIAIRDLIKTGLIKKYHNANGSNYIFYGVEKLSKKMIGKEELLINIQRD